MLFGELENSRCAEAEAFENTLVSLGGWTVDVEQHLTDCIDILNVWNGGIAALGISGADNTQDDLRELFSA